MLEFRKSGCIHHEFPILLFPRPKKKKGGMEKQQLESPFLFLILEEEEEDRARRGLTRGISLTT